MSVKIKKLKIKDELVYPATVLDAVKDGVKEFSSADGSTTQNPWYGKTVREILDYEQEIAKMEDGYTTEVTIGGMNKGSKIGGMTAEEVLDLILKPEYAPVMTDATCSITCAGHTNNEVVEVGTKTPTEASYSSSGNVASTVAGSYSAVGGTATDSFSITAKTAGTNLTYDMVTTKPGSFSVKATRAYAVGTDVVKTNKGNATNKLASNASTLIDNAAASTKVDAISNVIKPQTKEATFTIKYAYKVYASTVTAGTLTNQGLKTSVSNVEATLKGGAGGLKFAIPASYTGVKIEEYNNTLKSWTDTTSNWETSTVTYKLVDNSDINYTVYSRAKNSGEDMKARISATIA